MAHALKKRKLQHETAEHDTADILVKGAQHDPGDQQSSTDAERMSKQGKQPRSASFSGDIINLDVFQIQISELIDEVNLKDTSWRSAAEKDLFQVKKAIENIPAVDALPAQQATKSFQKKTDVLIPFCGQGPAADAKYKLAYSKPSNINVIGSFVLGTAIRSPTAFSIDMAITMPPELLQDKDYLDYRYFHKRAFYLACIAAGLTASLGSEFQMSYQYLHDNTLQPVVAVRPLNSEKYQIRLLLSPGSKTFAIEKTMPWKACIRESPNDTSATLEPVRPSPIYNASIRVDASLNSSLKQLHQTSKDVGSFQRACILGRTWLQQRSFASNIHDGGFGSFEFATILALLLQGGGTKGKSLLSAGYNEYQLFKGVLQFLAARDLVREPIVIGADSSYDSKMFRSKIPMFFDGSRAMNILFKMTPWSYRRLRAESKQSLKLLGSTIFDRFEPGFITKVADPLYLYDCYFSLDLGTGSHEIKKDVRDIASSLYNCLHTALGDRVSLINIDLPSTGSWFLQSKAEVLKPTASVGLLLNPENVMRVVDQGPTAEDKKAAEEFRRFWGEKAELRRFKDGSILESLVWSDKAADRSILQQIIHYIIGRHLGEGFAKSLKFHGGRLRPTFAKHSGPGTEYTSSIS